MRYVWLAVLIVFMPAVAMAASTTIAHVYSWRLFWTVPVPLLISLAAGLAATQAPSRTSVWGATALAAAAFVLAGPATTAGLFSFRNIGRPKVVDAPYAAAQHVVALARSDAPALVPESVAVYVPAFPHAPPLIGVRTLYLDKLQGFVPAAELAERIQVFHYIDGVNPGLPVDAALRWIAAHGVDTVAFAAGHRDAAILAPALAARGFTLDRFDGYIIATRRA